MKFGKNGKLKWTCLLMGAVMSMALVFGACGQKTPDDTGKEPPQQGEVTPPEQQQPLSTYREGYTPTRFKDVTNEKTTLADGAVVVENTLTKNNGQTVKVFAVEVDLTKVTVRAGTTDNKTYDNEWKKSVPYAQAKAWETATGGHVYASVNADFFGDWSVNAFVKDGYILKDGHNDNGNYDYLNLSSDVPASAPMLFGIKGNKAQIAPITSYSGDITSASVKEKLIKSKLYYSLAAGSNTARVEENAAPSASTLSFNTKETVAKGVDVVIKVDVSKGYQNMKVLEKETFTSQAYTPKAGEYAYLSAVSANANAYRLLNGIKVGDTVSVNVTSDGGKWNGYKTVLGCRQALVLNDAIADTITKENTNGAQSADIPRTCVGIRKDGKVVVFAVESLWYYNSKYGFLEEGAPDPHGMSLPELAEFCYYYNCEQAANFDGGGSTQLVVRGENETEGRVLVRAAETASTDPLKTRIVMNSLLVTSK